MGHMYYVVYERYSEFDQFEGTYYTECEKYRTYEAAQLAIDEMKKNDNYRKIQGPLILAKKEE